MRNLFVSWVLQELSKSTFINNLSTIDIPTKGFVYINGKEVRQMSEEKSVNSDIKIYDLFSKFNLLDST